MSKRNAIWFAAALGVSVSHGALADVQYSLEAGVGQSDNMTRSSTDEVDETIATAGVNLRWIENRSRLDADVSANARYFEYLDDTYDSEVVGTANASLLFGIIPERFTWLLQDSFGQERSDPFTPVTPDSREDVNYFTTGPQFTFRFGSTGVARLLARYSDTQYEISPFDGDRLGVGIALGRQPSPKSEISLNAYSEQVHFDDPGNVEYDRDNVYVSYSIEGARTEIEANLGYTMLDMATGEESDEPLFELEIRRDLAPGSALSLELSSELTDSSEAMRGAVDGLPTSGAGGAVAASDPYRNRSVALNWTLSRNRTSLNFSVDRDEDRYETQTQLDRTSLLWSASVERNVRPTLNVGLFATLGDEEFENTALSADELRYGVTLTWQFARTLSLRLLGERYDRDSSDATGEFVENRAFLTLVYRPRDSQIAAPGNRP